MSSLTDGAIHPDLVMERAKASFDVSKLSLFVRGGPQMAALRDRLLGLLSSHPVRIHFSSLPLNFFSSSFPFFFLIELRQENQFEALTRLLLPMFPRAKFRGTS